VDYESKTEYTEGGDGHNQWCWRRGQVSLCRQVKFKIDIREALLPETALMYVNELVDQYLVGDVVGTASTSGLLHRTSFGKITSEGRRPGASGRPRVRTNVRVGRRPADGPGGRPVLRQSAQPPYRKTARKIITFFNFFSPLQGSPSSTVAPRVTPQSYFLL
jgi:hypothetical protein